MRPAFGGIDFGTSNSTVGVVRNGQPRLVALEDGQVTLPSAVFFNFEDNRTCFGRHAITNYTDSVEGRLMRSLKSVLGSSLAHEKTRIKARSIGFMEIIGLFLGHLRKKLEEDAAGKWYTLKFAVDVKGSTAHLRGKMWPRGEEEPAEWSIETIDPHPIEHGSPGLYVYRLSDCYFDNVIVSEPEGAVSE